MTLQHDPNSSVWPRSSFVFCFLLADEKPQGTQIKCSFIMISFSISCALVMSDENLPRTCTNLLKRKPKKQDHPRYVHESLVFMLQYLFSALQVQAGWAFSENVNLLVAGYNRPKFGNAGSGVYLGNTIYLQHKECPHFIDTILTKVAFGKNETRRLCREVPNTVPVDLTQFSFIAFCFCQGYTTARSRETSEEESIALDRFSRSSYPRLLKILR